MTSSVGARTCRADARWSCTAFMGTRSARTRRRCAARSRRRRSLPEDGIAGWIAEGSPDAPNDRRDARQMGDARAPEDRPHRLPVADPALHRSAGGVHLRPDQGRARGRQGDGRNAYDIDGRRIHARGRALLVRYDPAHLRHQGSGARPSGDDRARRRHVAPRPDPAVRRPVCDLARPLRELSATTTKCSGTAW